MNKTHFSLPKLSKVLTFGSILLYSSTIFSQSIGINTQNPQGILHVDGKGDNDKKLKPTIIQQANDFIITESGNVGIGTTNPTNKLHISTSDNPIKVEGLQEGDVYTNNILVLDNQNQIKKANTFEKLSLPSPAVFRVQTDQNNFLQNSKAGQSQIIPMKMIKNAITGLKYNEASNTITFPKGTYQISFIYEATHSATNCTISSYFIDLPLDNSFTRIHSTASHNGGANSNHGGTITYASTVPQNRQWKIQLGRGQSGNCIGQGMSLKKLSTQIIIFRLGD